MLPVVLLTALFTATGVVLVVLGLLIAAHTLLSYVDVRYTQPRRHISPLEQHVHAFLVVLPMVGVAVVAVLDGQYGTHDAWVSWRQPALTLPQLMVLALSLLLGGVPVMEEWWRASRSRSAGRMAR
jgi:hypothetical protein